MDNDEDMIYNIRKTNSFTGPFQGFDSPAKSSVNKPRINI